MRNRTASCTPADVLQRTPSGVNQIERVFHHLLRFLREENAERLYADAYINVGGHMRLLIRQTSPSSRTLQSAASLLIECIQSVGLKKAFFVTSSLQLLSIAARCQYIRIDYQIRLAFLHV